MNKLISIIIPIYNIVSYLERCIISVINQTYNNLQIILVDDGSTDGSAEICDRYTEIDSRIKVVHKENGGSMSARNAGLVIASGEYIGFIDGDDWIEPDMYERLLAMMIESDADLVESDAYMDMGEETIPMRSRMPYGTYDADMVIPKMLCDADFNICPLKAYVWSKLFRKDLLEKVQYLVDDSICFGEDVAVTYPYILQCRKVVITDYIGYHYVQRQGSLVYTKDALEWKKNLALIKYLNDNFCGSDKKSILLPQLNQYTKLLFLLRQISYFDREEKDKVLNPFGGLPLGERVIVYGAGRIGQSVYNYLSGMESITVMCWLDREYKKYGQMGLDVLAPDTVFNKAYEGAKIVIAVNSKRAAKGVRNWLMENGIEESSVLYLTDEFFEGDLVSRVLEDEVMLSWFERRDYKKVALCGYRESGKILYNKLKSAGIEITFIVERNYEALRETEEIDVPIVGFEDKEIYEQADILLLTPDLNYEFIKECIELAGITIPVVLQTDILME